MIRLRNMLMKYGILLDIAEVEEDGREHYVGSLRLGKFNYTFIQQKNKTNGIAVITEGIGVCFSKQRVHSVKAVIELLDKRELEKSKELYERNKTKARDFFEPFRDQRITFKEKQIELVALLMMEGREDV